jgi:hypothetical protein
MTVDAWLTLAILIVMFGLLVQGKLPAGVVLLGALTAAMTLRLAPEEDLLKGFSNSSVLTVAVLFIVVAGMYSTGADGKRAAQPPAGRSGSCRSTPRRGAFSIGATSTGAPSLPGLHRRRFA